MLLRLVLLFAAGIGAAGMAFVFTWLRFSSNRLLDWQRCFSYQPRDITWAQQQVRECLCLVGGEVLVCV
jgi:alpha-glucan,water dikinase